MENGNNDIPMGKLMQGVWEPIIRTRRELLFEGKYSEEAIDKAIADCLPRCITDVIKSWVEGNNE